MEAVMKYVSFVAIVVGVYLQTAQSQTGDKVCYCLSKEVGSLRNPVHIEPVILDNKQVYLVAEQIGIINVYKPNDAGNKVSEYVDISDKVVCEPEVGEERGLLGFAIHPNFTENKKLYTYSIRELNGKNYAVISEIVDKAVEIENTILLIEQPGGKRNGGQLVFGQDGFLYISIGDGGPQNDSDIEAQNGASFLGKILRIDIDKTDVVDNKLQRYTVPDDNPKKPGWRPEVYAIGMRNAWRCFEDPGDANGVGKGRIFCGELGESAADEIDILQKGGNYGWNYKEGKQCVSSNNTKCTSIDGEVLPIIDFPRGSTNITAVVGGPVYRGARFTELYGQFVYGDYISSDLYKLKEGTSGTWSSSNFPRCADGMCECGDRQHSDDMLLSVGVSHDEELFLMKTEDMIATTPNGAIYRLKPPNKSGHVTCGSSSVSAINIFYNLVISIVSFLFFKNLCS